METGLGASLACWILEFEHEGHEIFSTSSTVSEVVTALVGLFTMWGIFKLSLLVISLDRFRIRVEG